MHPSGSDDTPVRQTASAAWQARSGVAVLAFGGAVWAFGASLNVPQPAAMPQAAAHTFVSEPAPRAPGLGATGLPLLFAQADSVQSRFMLPATARPPERAVQVAQAQLAQAQAAPAPAVAAPAQPAASPPSAAPPLTVPPPARDLTPAEISALQTLMTDRAAGTVLTPANTEALRNRILDTQGAIRPPGMLAQNLRPHPRRIDVDPQTLLSTPPTVQLALGVVTPLTFLDSAGRPWPVESVAFDPRMFAQDGAGCGSAPPTGAVAGAGERPTTITISPCRINTWGNVSIKLEGYPLPVILMARSGSSTDFDLPVTIRVSGRSPSAPVVTAEAAAAYTPPPARYVATDRRRSRNPGPGPGGRMEPDRFLDSFGAGTAPPSAQRVDVNDPTVTGWVFNGRLYLRGAFTVVNPAQDAVGESVGGVKVWRFDHPVPRVLVIDQAGAERDLAVTF